MSQFDVFVEEESWNYFKRNHEGQDLRSLPLHPLLARLIEYSALKLPAGCSILEIGCSAANNLFQCCKLFDAARGVGMEPSAQLVEHLRGVYPELTFVQSAKRFLPFEKDEFDLVIVRCVLSWMERDDVLQMLGEIIRVCRSHFIISDFAPALPYSVEYHHRAGCRTYKMDYRPLLNATGNCRCVSSFVVDEHSEYDIICTALYQKLAPELAFPPRSPAEFVK